ncbi:NAD(P)-binding protein, partial [Desulfobacterium sp. N47]
CAKVCPVTLPNEYDETLSERKAVYKQYAQAIPGAYSIQKSDKAPCRLACPAGLNVQGYVQMVGQGKYKEALQIIMEDLPLPGVLGRICPHGCEDACRRCDVDNPVAIRSLKRLAADKFDPRQIEIKTLPKRDEKVAIIGSGPAGLSAAYHLARKGVLSTVFEALPKAGGMLRVGIPEHRLPRNILDNEIEVITNLGVEIKTNTPLGPDLSIDDLFSQGYKSVYLAIGAHKGFDLGVPGEKAKGVRQGVDFLREVNLTGKSEVGKKVAIIGGGNVAIDVARCAVRLGAEKVNIIYRRTRAEMPAWEEEIHAAKTEGAEITYLAAPQEVLTSDGKVVGLRCIRMELGEPDSSGRRRPVPVVGSEYDIEIDQLIPAIGQKPDLTALENITGVDFSKWGTVETDSVTYATGRPGVFAGGDVQTGPWVAIGAIAAGREAAESIIRYLDGKDMAEGREAIVNENPVYRPIPKNEPKKSRIEMPELAAEKRAGNFKEVELGYCEEDGAAEAGRCLNCGYCCECLQCVDACLAGAVDHSQTVVEKQIDIGSVILCPGADTYDPSVLDEFYHYKTNPNVLTSLEFERILSASGPTMGHLVRMSDHKEPKKIAWLQCVGSRDNNHCGNGYCSSVCCMYAVKEAVVAKEHAGGDLDCAIFYMDMRTNGKEFERFYNNAKDKHGVRFINSRVHSIESVPETGDLSIRYVTGTGETKIETFDQIVLSVGLEISKETLELAKRLGIETTEGNFCKTSSLEPVNSSKEGVYVCGSFQGPKDIPQSVIDAGAAAAIAGKDLCSARNTLTRDKQVTPEINVIGDTPRIGVFVCNCGINISSVVNVPEVVKYAGQLPGVVFSSGTLFTCSQDSQENIRKAIAEQGLNRVVVAACTPRTHEVLFQQTIQEAGLNPYLFEFANIRDQNAWVHQKDPESATQKAKDLVRMAVARSALLEPISSIQIEINHDALVIGGGISGMSAALTLADQGFKTYLVEKSSELGGQALVHAVNTWQGDNVTAFLSGIKDKVTNHKNIEVLLESDIKNIDGFVGNFTTSVNSAQKDRKINHGAVILAIGANPLEPNEYLYGQSDRVMKWHELESMFESHPEKLEESRAIAFIQCVGSREPARPYCSKICCTASVKSAIAIKEKKPETNIYIIYRDMRTFGLREELYKRAREMGVTFIRYNVDEKPVVEKDGNEGLIITVKDHILNTPLQISVDYLNLATAIVPAEDRKSLAQMLKVPLNEEGFYMEAHMKLKPVDFSTDGVFLAGLAHYPKPIEESISQAQAAAGRAALILNKSTIQIEPIVSVVDEGKCIGCGLCEQSCAFGAIRLKQVHGKGYRAGNYSALCKGCGVCAAGCPQRAIDMKHFSENQILASICAGGANG